MNTNLEFYVKKVSNFLDKEFCNEVIQNIQSLNWQQHNFTRFDIKNKKWDQTKLSGEQELDTTYADDKNSKHSDIIMEKLWHEIKKYQNDYQHKWFNGWAGYTPIRFNRYEKTKKMAEHCDYINSIFDGVRKGGPMLSLLGLLNDDYNGGKFVMFEKEEINLKQGDLLIFPSNFLYPHRVDPVIQGVRYSYISWVY